jgi:hypothetical protein
MQKQQNRINAKDHVSRNIRPEGTVLATGFKLTQAIFNSLDCEGAMVKAMVLTSYMPVRHNFLVMLYYSLFILYEKKENAIRI